MPSFTVRSSQSQVYQVPRWPEPGKSKGPHSWKIRSLTNFHMHLGKACFSMWAVLATVLFHGSHPLAYALLNEELQLKWSSPETMEKWPLELRVCNCFIVSDYSSESQPSQFQLFLEPICSYSFRKMGIYSCPFLIYLFYFSCSTCILCHCKSNKPFLLVSISILLVRVIDTDRSWSYKCCV